LFKFCFRRNPLGVIACYFTLILTEAGEFEELEDGDVVTLTHSAMGIESRLGLVARDYLSPVAQTLRVIILPDY
jgi:hypothetical protein